jgi:hypothetical protein
VLAVGDTGLQPSRVLLAVTIASLLARDSRVSRNLVRSALFLSCRSVTGDCKSERPVDRNDLARLTNSASVSCVLRTPARCSDLLLVRVSGQLTFSTSEVIESGWSTGDEGVWTG